MPHSQFVFFIQMSGFVFFQSSLIFKRGFLSCSDAFAGYFKKTEILFPAFLVGFFPPCLLSSCGHLNQLLQDSSFSVTVVPMPGIVMWHQEGLCKGGLPGLAVYFLFSLLVHLVNPEKKPFFGQTAQLELQ